MERYSSDQHSFWDKREDVMFSHYMSLYESQTMKPPQWSSDFVEQCKSIFPDIAVYQLTCLFVSPVTTGDEDETRQCHHRIVPCMQINHKAIFMPMPQLYTDQTEWKLAVLHEYTHIVPPNPTHNEAFQSQLRFYCKQMGLPYRFAHIVGVLYLL